MGMKWILIIIIKRELWSKREIKLKYEWTHTKIVFCSVSIDQYVLFNWLWSF